MPNKSKTKGNAFEREVAKKLSLWISAGTDEYALSKRSGSGGAPRDLQGASGVSGDLQADKQEYKWFDEKISVECKHYKDLNSELWRWMANRDSVLWDFIRQALEAAKEYKGRKFMLVFKGDRMPPIVITDLRELSGEFQKMGLMGKISDKKHWRKTRTNTNAYLPYLCLGFDVMLQSDIKAVKRILKVS